MEFTPTEGGVEFTISKNRFSDLVGKLRKETSSLLTVSEVTELLRENPGMTQLPFGKYHLHFFPEDGKYLCTLAYRDSGENDNHKLGEIIGRINLF
jgi:hypothetical protein